MTEASEHKSWWVTLPGILTQVVALITALTGLIAALYQSGFFGHQGTPAHEKVAEQDVAHEAAPPSTISDANERLESVPPPQPAAPIAPPKGAFAIKIGDTVSESVPGPGAGMIESPGTEDVYQFSAAPNQRVYFRMLEHGANMYSIKWRLTDQDEQEVFNTCLGCSEPGMQSLVRGGQYVLTVGNPHDAATGTYRLELTTP